MQHSTSADINCSDFSIFIFQVNHVFMKEKDNPLKKDVIDKEELDCIEIEGILSLEHLTRAMFID